MHAFELLKKIFPNLLKGLLGGLLTGLLLGNSPIAQDNVAKPVFDNVPKQSQSLSQTVDFNATLVNKDNKVLEGHEVSIYDITDGRVFVQKLLSNSDGLASFKGLKTNRSYSVSIDGEAVGYTFRNSDRSEMGRTFILNEVSNSNAKTVVSNKLASVRANNEEGEVLAAIKISLYNAGEQVAEALTDENGLANFAALQDGVYYDIYVNNEPYNNFVRTGETTDVYLSAVSTESESGSQSKDTVSNDKTFNFIAKTVNADLNLIPEQALTILDTTNGRETVAEANTNINGEFLFTDLKTNRSYTVLVNGEETGYTFRSSDETTISHNFEVKVASKEDSQAVQTVNSTVNVTNEDELPLAGKEVSLSRDGKVVSTATTDESGNAVLTNLLEGTIYDISVDGVSYPFFIVRGGSNLTIAVN